MKADVEESFRRSSTAASGQLEWGICIQICSQSIQQINVLLFFFFLEVGKTF